MTNGTVDVGRAHSLEWAGAARAWGLFSGIAFAIATFAYLAEATGVIGTAPAIPHGSRSRFRVGAGQLHDDPRPRRTVPKEPPMTAAPAIVRTWNPLVRRLLRFGVPMGPNVLLTVKGRTSGEPRTAPVAVAEIGGRRYVIGAYGEVHWVRNLRAAGEADIDVHGRHEHVLATELDRDAAVVFYRDALPSYTNRLPRVARAFLQLLFRSVAPEVVLDPEKAAETRPVFELHRATAATSPAG
jgi:deazaflavin-dependent oxidoreductase (nitroreductase family)